MTLSEIKSLEVNIKLKKEECRIMYLKLNHRDELILKYANDTLLSFLKLSDDVLGNKVNQIFDKNITQELTEDFFYYRSNNESCSYLTKYEKSINSSIDETYVWKYRVIYEDNSLLYIGKRICESKHSLIADRKSNFLKLNYTNYQFLTIQKKGDQYYCSADDRIPLPMLDSKQFLNESLTFLNGIIYNSNLYGILDSCLNSRKVMEFVDCIDCRSGVQYFKFCLIPSKNIVNEIQVLTICISKEDYENEKFKQYSHQTFFPNVSRYASCTIFINDNKKYCDLGNRQFYEILEEFQIQPEDIIDTTEFKNTLKYNIFTQTVFHLKNSHGITYPFHMSFIPINTIIKNSSKVLFIGTIPENMMDDNQLEHILTKRELEVASLVARNESNKYIAHKLKISEGTVKRILYNVYQKLNISSRVELTKLIYRCIN